MEHQYFLIMDCGCHLDPGELKSITRPDGTIWKICPEHGKRIVGKTAWCIYPSCGIQIFSKNIGGTPPRYCKKHIIKAGNERLREKNREYSRKRSKALKQMREIGKDRFQCAHFETLCGFCVKNDAPCGMYEFNPSEKTA